MSRTGRKGALVWILGCLSLVASLNLFTATLHLALLGGDYKVDMALFGLILGNIEAAPLFWTSLIITFVLFGATSFAIYRGFPADPEVLQRLAKLESSLALNANMLENTQIGFFRRLEENEKANDEMFRKMNMNLDENLRKTEHALQKQKKAVQEVVKQNKENAKTGRKHAAELTSIRRRVEKIEKALVAPKAKLSSQSSPSKIKGVNSTMTKELKAMGITTVGQFLTASPASIAERVDQFPETIAGLQARAQLLMVPGIGETEANLLVEAGVTSRRELANRDPIQLCRAIVQIAKTLVEQRKMSARKIPTLQDVSSWIKLAKL